MAREAAGAQRNGTLTISKLAALHGLSRSTLLYYDRIGLLRADRQSTAGYRLYGPDAATRLARIVELRSAGLPLETVKRVLESRTPLAEALERQVVALNKQIEALRTQQRVVLSLLQTSTTRSRARTLSKEAWTKMFRSIGLTDADMRRWHAQFEQSMPEAHRDFLESLGLETAEVRRIRAWSVSAAGD
jgi:DNA-binding transcriptional MerR regulator